MSDIAKDGMEGLTTSFPLTAYTIFRRYWTQLSKVIRSTSRVIWWSIPEVPQAPENREWTPGELECLLKEELLTKATAVRILVGFAYALKHHLRGEFGTEWEDLKDLVGFLPTVSTHIS